MKKTLKSSLLGYTIPIEIKNIQFFDSARPFELESGEHLSSIRVAYHTFGTLNTTKDNVIWVCHALTANSDVSDWWDKCFGAGKMIDPTNHFVVCANILGSNYGSTSPRSICEETGVAYGLDFPQLTMRDIVKAHHLLVNHLGIQKIEYGIGGSCGGHQVLEMAVMYPGLVQKMVLLVTSAKETPWAIATHEAQRMSLESDPTWTDNTDKAAWQGLRSARAMALLMYRTFDSYRLRQTDTDERLDDFSAASYVRYQGLKLERRFYAHNYWYLLKALDTHDIGRGRGGVQQVLSNLNQPSLVISMDSDLLIPPSEQAILAEHLPYSKYVVIETMFGHDGFLIEAEKINAVFNAWKTNF